MLRGLLIFFIVFFVFKKTYSEETQDCSIWGQKKETPCIIIKKTPNTSFFSEGGVNKITISKKEIEQSGAVDLIDVLNSLPDINITQSGSKGQQASIFMRGTGSNHTLVMINGIPINDQSTTQGLHDFGVDFIQTVQQIEIYPGSNATHFGTNAIGGAINMITGLEAPCPKFLENFINNSGATDHSPIIKITDSAEEALELSLTIFIIFDSSL